MKRAVSSRIVVYFPLLLCSVVWQGAGYLKGKAHSGKPQFLVRGSPVQFLRLTEIIIYMN